MSGCLQEDCANWDGDGCPCRVLDVEPVDVRAEGFDPFAPRTTNPPEESL